MSSGVTVLHTEASDGWGGQEIRVLDEMLGMKKRGHNVLLAAPSQSRIFQRASREGIESYPFTMGKAGFVMDVFRLAGLIRERGVDILNTHSSRDSWIGSIAGMMTGVKVIRSRHISSRLHGDPLTKLVYNQLSDAIITTGSFVRDQLVRDVGVDPGRVFSIPTGVDVRLYEKARGEDVRSSLGIRPEEKVLGVAAVLRSWKGHDYLVKAMPSVLADFPDARLVIAGEGPRRGKIEALVRELGLGDRVILTGHRNDIARVIKSFDISLLVSYASEGVPQFLLQSMAAGKPLVGARTGGIPEVIDHGVNGLVVEPRDPDAIASAVKSLLGDPELMKRMGEAGHRMVLERYTRDRMLDDIEALYGRLLK